MTTPKLKQLEQRLNRSQAPAAVPSPTGGLAAALEQLVEQEIARRLEQQPRSPRLRKILNDFDRKPEAPWRPEGGQFADPPVPAADRAWIAPAEREPVTPMPAKAPAGHMTMAVQRDEAGRPVSTTVNGRSFKIIRDELGRMTGMREED